MMASVKCISPNSEEMQQSRLMVNILNLPASLTPDVYLMYTFYCSKLKLSAL